MSTPEEKEKERKTKRINIRIAPTQHDWLFKHAKERETTVSKLFSGFVVTLQDKEQASDDADPDADV